MGSFLVSGRPLKSINQYYNKQRAKLQSALFTSEKRHNSHRLDSLTRIRNNKIRDYIHKSTAIIANQLASSGVTEVYVGYCKGWKQGVNIGRQNNQMFVQIPFLSFVSGLEYKCALIGIVVHRIDESFTSVCSALDSESVNDHSQDGFVGKRVKRGLFRTKNARYVNADINAAMNIYRQAIGRDLNKVEVDRGQVSPSRLKVAYETAQSCKNSSKGELKSA